MAEKLIRTPFIDEALAYTEAFLFGNRPMKLWIIRAQGSGKSFLADWARRQTENGKRGAIFDANPPQPDLPFWLASGSQLEEWLRRFGPVEVEWERNAPAVDLQMQHPIAA